MDLLGHFSYIHQQGPWCPFKFEPRNSSNKNYDILSNAHVQVFSFFYNELQDKNVALITWQQ